MVDGYHQVPLDPIKRRLGSSSCVSSDLNEIVRLRDVGPRSDPEAILDNSELLLLSSKSRGFRLVVF